MPLSASFLKTKGLRLLGGGTRASGLIRRRLISDVCSRRVFLNASESMARTGMINACRDLYITCFSLKLLCLSDDDEIKYRNARLSHLIW